MWYISLCFCMNLNCFWFETTSERTNYFCCWELRNTYCLKTDTQIQALIRHVFHSFQEPLGGVEIWRHINARLIPCPYRQLHMQINSSPFSLRFPLVLMPRKQTHAFPSKCRIFQSPLFRNQRLSCIQFLSRFAKPFRWRLIKTLSCEKTVNRWIYCNTGTSLSHVSPSL